MTTRALWRAAVKAAVFAAAETGTALKESAIVWSDMTGLSAGDPLVVLTVISDVQVQPTRETLAAAGDDLQRTIADVRDLVVQVRVESLRRDVLDLTDEIRLGLDLQASRALLEAQCKIVSLDRVGTRDLSYGAAGQRIQARCFEIALRAAFERVDPTSVGTIETVKASGTVTPPTIAIPEDTITEEEP